MPDIPALFQQAAGFHRVGDLAAAENLYGQVLAAEPSSFAALHMLGVLRAQQERPEDAVALIGAALAQRPDVVPALMNYANVLGVLERDEDAIAAYDRALALKPGFAPALAGRGLLLWRRARFDDALISLEAALAAAPDMAQAWCNHGLVLHELGRLSEALQSFSRATAIDPDHAEAHWNKSLVHLLRQEFAQGWRLYDWHLKLPRPIDARDYAQPRWTGAQDLRGKTLFLYSGQGLGDTIQFYRYAAMARTRDANVVLSPQPCLMRLLRQAPASVPLAAAPPPHFDFHAALMDLPCAFAGDADAIALPYLRAEPQRVAAWREKIRGHGFRIGVCWQGESRATLHGRSFPAACLNTLAELPGVRLISLQKNRETPPGIETLEGLDDGPDAFIDTAAVMENLDLVITADTSIAHLAGALARPAWVALKHVPDWRWFLEREDSPWYASLRLFRQSAPGDWNSVFTAMKAALICDTARRARP